MLPKIDVIIKRKTDTNIPGNQYVQAETTVLSGKRRIVMAEGRGLGNISTPEGLNLDFDILVYLEKGDPEIRYADIVEFDLGGQKRALVNKIRPMTITIQGKQTEVFCRYN
jgi:hypothetical protein